MSVPVESAIRRGLAFAGGLCAAPCVSFGAASPQTVLQLPGVTVRTESVPVTIIVLLTLLTLLPAILLSMTPFVRILIIFHFLRQALGTQTAPTNQTLIGLSLFLTYFLMQPVLLTIQREAIGPYESNRITVWQALDRGAVPVRHYMLNYTREKDLALFLEMSKEPRPTTPDTTSSRDGPQGSGPEVTRRRNSGADLTCTSVLA